jgi:hypothetical protein
MGKNTRGGAAMVRQGDLLIVKVDRIPEDAKIQEHRILAEGEATGHIHELDSGQVYEREGTLYFKVAENEMTTLRHPEHGPVTFEAGMYQVIRQREYTPEQWKSWAYVRD